MNSAKYHSWKRLNPVGERPERPIQIQNPLEIMSECSGSGFLLDWLVGGEASARNIQGFSIRFEGYLATDAGQASQARQADQKRAHAR